MSHIAFISTMEGYPWGGSEYLWAAIAQQALLQNHKVSLSLCDWSIDHPIVLKLRDQGAQIFPRPRLQKSNALITRAIKKLRPVASQPSSYLPIFRNHPEVIFINQGGTYDIIHSPELINLLQSSGIPYFIICHFNTDTTVLDRPQRALANQIFANAAGVFFVSQSNLKQAERQLARSLPNASVVRNPTNLTEFEIVPSIIGDRVHFATVARLETLAKGQDILLEALGFPIWKTRNWQCNLYGSGPDKAYLEALAAHYDIADRVVFHGHVNDVREIWAENHLLVLPSRAEGTPLALVEAMICGRPAIVTDVGGNLEWLEDGKTGFVASAATAKSIYAALERAWSARNAWTHMGIQAHQSAIAKFDPSPGQTLLNVILEPLKPSYVTAY